MLLPSSVPPIQRKASWSRSNGSATIFLVLTKPLIALAMIVVVGIFTVRVEYHSLGWAGIGVWRSWLRGIGFISFTEHSFSRTSFQGLTRGSFPNRRT